MNIFVAYSLFLFLSNHVLAQLPDGLPDCACLADAITAAGCGLGDAECSCGDARAAITDQATPCILDACSIDEALMVQTVTDGQCANVQSQSSSTPSSPSVTTSISPSSSSSASGTSPSSASETSPSSAPQENSSNSGGGLSETTKVGLGVGLGLGIPLLITINGMFCMLLYRRRKKSSAPGNHGIDIRETVQEKRSELHGDSSLRAELEGERTRPELEGDYSRRDGFGGG